MVPDGGNRPYTLSFRNKVNIVTAGGGAKIYARARVVDASGTQVASVSSAPNLTNTGWGQNSLAIPATPARLVEIRFVIEGLIGEVWFDHIHWSPTAEGLLGLPSRTSATAA